MVVEDPLWPAGWWGANVVEGERGGMGCKRGLGGFGCDEHLWSAGGARGVIECLALPLVLREEPSEVVGARSEELLVGELAHRCTARGRRVGLDGIDEIHDCRQRRAAWAAARCQLVERRPRRRSKGGVRQEHLAVGVIKDVRQS